MTPISPPFPASNLPTHGAIFNMAWPLALKAMMLHGIVVIDALLVAPLGEAALAAMGLAGAMAGVLSGFLMAFSMATQIRVAQAFGAASEKALKTGFYCGLFINLTVIACGLAFVVTFSPWALSKFAHTSDIASQAQAYLNVFLFVLLAEAVGQAIAGHFNGCGKTKLPFYSHLIALPTNVITSYCLIHGAFGAPELGVVGAAVGSVVASTLRVVFLSTRFWQATAFFRDVPGWSHDRFTTSLWRHLRFSLPIAATFVSNTLAAQTCTLIFAKLSVNHFAALTLINPWVMVLGTLAIAWAQATGLFVAQLLGKSTPPEDMDAFLSRAWRGIFVTSVGVALTYLAFCLSVDWMYADLQGETRALLYSFLPILLILPFPKGSNAICGNSLRAAGDTVYVMHIFIWSQWAFRVPLTALFVLYLDLSATWVFATFLLEELVKFFPFHRRIWKGDWKHRKPLV